jgi:hypothetical protein
MRTLLQAYRTIDARKGAAAGCGGAAVTEMASSDG